MWGKKKNLPNLYVFITHGDHPITVLFENQFSLTCVIDRAGPNGKPLHIGPNPGKPADSSSQLFNHEDF
jgi:hypothetical protein